MPATTIVHATARQERNSIDRRRRVLSILARRASCSFSLMLLHVSKAGNFGADPSIFPSEPPKRIDPIVRDCQPPRLHLPHRPRIAPQRQPGHGCPDAPSCRRWPRPRAQGDQRIEYQPVDLQTLAERALARAKCPLGRNADVIDPGLSRRRLDALDQLRHLSLEYIGWPDR